MTKPLTFRFLSGFILIISVVYACSKGGSATPPDPCAGVTVSVNATVTNTSAAGVNDGSITITASGGSGFTYKLGSGTYQSGNIFAGLAAGSYTVTAKNANGCTGSATFTVSAPANPCAGLTIIVTGTVNHPTGASSGDGSISAGATGSSNFTYSLNGGAYQASGNFTGLSAGSYTVTAKDGNGCTGNTVFVLTAPNPCAGITIGITGTITHPTSAAASDGTITVTATGSTGFTFNINGGVYQAGNVFTGLAAGVYTIGARDLNGCTGTAGFTLNAPNPCAGVTITVSNIFTGNTPCQSANGTLTATANGGTGPYLFSLNSGVFQASNVFMNLGPGSYTVQAKDANNCTGTSAPGNVVNLPAGPLFSEVKNVISNYCIGCHNNVQQEGGMNWAVDCNIVNFRDRILARAVNANPSAMPPTGLIPAAERQKIQNWINAGGKFTD